MISELDDYLIHQTCEPVRFVGTSDRNFYDRHYFSMHRSDGKLFMVFGFGQYPNLGTEDAFVAIRIGDRQYVVRSSGELGDRSKTACGPFRVDVLKGLERLRLAIGPNDLGIEADLLFQGVHFPVMEPPQRIRQHGRLLWDLVRYGQTGTYSGTLVTPEGRYDIGPPTWKGYRDRSWGVRPVGEAEPKGIRTKADNGQFWFYCCAQFNDFTLMLKVHDLANGKRNLEEAIRVWHDPTRDIEDLGSIELDLDRSENGEFIRRAVIRCRYAPDGPMAVEVEQLLPLYLMKGTGYVTGFADEAVSWRHGAYQGRCATETEVFDLGGPGPHGPSVIDAVGRFRLGDEIGHGLFEYFLLGPFQKFGLDAPGFWNDRMRRT